MLNIVQKIKNVFKLKCILQKSKFYVEMIIFVKLKHRTDIIEHIHFFDCYGNDMYLRYLSVYRNRL